MKEDWSAKNLVVGGGDDGVLFFSTLLLLIELICQGEST